MLMLLWCLNHYAQNPDIKRTWHWYFGAGAGLDFSSGFPVADTTGKLFSVESSAAISDINGNLLFYTDGDSVWNSSHQVMPNGFGLYGSCIPPGPQGSAVQGALIVPHPDNENIYYIFTVDCGENTGLKGLNYSIVDMTMDGGKGDIISKNNLLFKPSTEVLTATRDNKNGYWIITHEPDNNVFLAYHITKFGIDTMPVISKTGLIFKDFYGTIKVSPNTKLISFTSTYGNQLFKFNNSTGKIVYWCTLPNVISGAYSTSFSPDNTKVYYTDSGNMIYAFDLCLDDTLMIQKSIDTIATTISNDTYTGLQLGSDYSLYVSSIFSDKISRIKNPDTKENFESFSIDLMGKKSYCGIINIPDFYFNKDVSSCNLNINNGDVLIKFIPNIFTPNADNINDYFSIQIAGYKHIEYFIYNRWGNLIHKGKQELNAGIKTEERLWDGRYKGDEVPAGVYFFLIKATKMNGEADIKKGFVQLLR